MVSPSNHRGEAVVGFAVAASLPHVLWPSAYQTRELALLRVGPQVLHDLDEEVRVVDEGA
jgi:hypothetical protein